MGTVSYDKDVILWAQEQARLLRSGQFSQLDIEHIADEIEDVGKSEERELANRMAVLLAHLLKWKHQPELRCPSWEATIKVQRKSISRRLRKTPSLKATLADSDWVAEMWDDAIAQASKETGIVLTRFGETSPWTCEEVLADEFWPD